jgi:hypothetical protein
MRMTMTLTSLSLSLSLGLACADDGGDVGDDLADDDAQGSSEETGSTGPDEASDANTSESTSANESSTSTDESDASSSTTDESSTSEGNDTSSDTSDPSCEDDQYLGAGIGADDWGLGSFCDDIWVCASADQVAALEALDPVVMCEPGMGCPDQHCLLSYQVIVDQPTLDRVCEALLLPGIDVAYCTVYGP